MGMDMGIFVPPDLKCHQRVSLAWHEVRDHRASILLSTSPTRVPIARRFQSRKGCFRYCVTRIISRLRPRWQGSVKALRRAVRRVLLPHRRNMGLLSRIMQTLHAPVVAALLIIVVTAQSAYAHERSPYPPGFTEETTPSGLTDIGSNSAPTLGDLDGDGDLDVLAGFNRNSFYYFQNTGTAVAPAFASGTTLSGLTGLSETTYFTKPVFGDLDGDGDLDILTGENSGTFIYFENTGTATAPTFVASTTLSGLSDVGGYSI